MCDASIFWLIFVFFYPYKFIRALASTRALFKMPLVSLTMEDTLGKNLGSVLGLSICMMGLSACATGKNIRDGNASTDVMVREDTGVAMGQPLTPELRRANESSLPTGYQMQTSSVEIMSDFNAAPPMAPMADPYVSTMNVSGDSSVTIFSLDGPVAPVSNYAGGSEFYDLSAQPQMPAMVAHSSASGQAAAQIFFGHGSSRLGSGDMNTLSQIAESMDAVPGRLTVEGHASRPSQTSDPVRGSILNLKESMNRAYEVSKALIQKGVPANRLKTTAYGDTMPSGNDEQQRRVDIISGGY